MTLKGSEIVEKKNVLNELRSNNMSLQELRFFSIYLSKINARDKSTRTVRFPLSDFQRIMEFGRLNIHQLQTNTNSLLSKVVNIPNEDGGYTGFTLFKRCKVFKDDLDEWFIEINASDDALPLMFDFKDKYFTYELWNALRLKSANQVRMYEILKQYEKIGKREIRVTELRELLGIQPNEYPQLERFKTRVLNSCQQALKENTDICYTYEPGKTGVGGKWLTIVFYIKKNEGYVDQLSLDEFIDLQPATETATEQTDHVVVEPEVEPNEDIQLLSDACNNAFSVEEMQRLDSVLRILPKSVLPQLSFTDSVELRRYHYLEQQYKTMVLYEKRGKIKNRFNYLLKIIQNDTLK